MVEVVVPAFIRGELINDGLERFGGREYGTALLAPAPAFLIDRLALRSAAQMQDLATLAFGDIVDYLAELGARLKLSDNVLLQEALAASLPFSDLTEPLLVNSYESLPDLFARDVVREMADQAIGIEYLDGWAESRRRDGRTVAIRAVGARSLHIVAGNSPMVSALSIVRNAITRGDAMIKVPSNDPLSALAIARTMAEMAPDHPITKHLAVAYWKGGTKELEARLCQPQYIDKIVAWGGTASLKHIAQYIQPGVELIALDPKRSASLIGGEAFKDEETLRDVARRCATDIGAMNQLGCMSARVLYVVCGTDACGLARINELGALVYEELMKLPTSLSTKPKRFDVQLQQDIDGVRTSDVWYRVFGGRHREGAVIVSQTSEEVAFSAHLSGRVANLVPIEHANDLIGLVNAYTQTIGIYPDHLKSELRDFLSRHGPQRVTSLGYAASVTTAVPQDGIEPLRRMCKWVVDETCHPDEVDPPWKEISCSTSQEAGRS